MQTHKLPGLEDPGPCIVTMLDENGDGCWTSDRGLCDSPPEGAETGAVGQQTVYGVWREMEATMCRNSN